jgi:putative ABC transport system permease protein
MTGAARPRRRTLRGWTPSEWTPSGRALSGWTLSRWTGAAVAGTLALALLVGGCVFTALAGPALSLHTRTEALRHTVAGLATTDKTVQMTAGWSDFTNPNGFSLNPEQEGLAPADLDASLSELSAGLAGMRLPVAAGAWASVTTRVLPSGLTAPPPGGAGDSPVSFEVAYRDPLADHARVVAGSYTGKVPYYAVGVAATTETARLLGLHLGSRLRLSTPQGGTTLVVTAIVAERDPGSTFWTLDPTIAAPSFSTTGESTPFWAGGLFADPDQLAAMQNALGRSGMTMNWLFPLALGAVTADEVPGLYDNLNRATAAIPALTGDMQPSAGTVTVGSPLIADLAAFLATQSAVQTVLLLLFVSLTVTGAAVIALAAWMIIARRDGELGTLRARGGSVRQLAVVTGRGALLAAVPGALLGAGLAVALVPGGNTVPSLGWWLAGVAVATAVAGPPLIAAWRHRSLLPYAHPSLLPQIRSRSGAAVNPARITTAQTRRSRFGWRRLVAELTACAACVAGVIVLRDQGLPANGGVNLYLSAMPVLVAIPVVLVMLRLYPLAVRGLLALSARGTSATGFVALSGATQPFAVLPAFALVLALGLASFAGTVSDGISRGEVAASWQSTGADAVITPGVKSGSFGPAAVRQIAAVPGVRQATAVWETVWQTSAGQTVTLLAVDPAGYAAFTAGIPFPPFPPFPASRLDGAAAAASGGAGSGGAASGGAIPVLASPAAAAAFGPSATELFSLTAMGPAIVRVAGRLSATPGVPGGGVFAVMALRTLPGANGRPAPNIILVNGASIDQARLSAVVSRAIPDAAITFRAAALAKLTALPLQHGGAVIVTLTIAAAAAFGLFIVLLGLAFGSAQRELTLARLVVMGYEQNVRLVLTEAMPAVLAAVVAGAACAFALPGLLGSTLDLSEFTGTSIQVQLQPDLAALGWPAACLILIAALMLVTETRAVRRRGVTGTLRAT